jgi:hypothetical protein
MQNQVQRPRRVAELAHPEASACEAGRVGELRKEVKPQRGDMGATPKLPSSARDREVQLLLLQMFQTMLALCSWLILVPARAYGRN